MTVRWTGRATHRGEIDIIQQMPALMGKPVTWFGVEIHPITQGKIVEMWRVVGPARSVTTTGGSPLKALRAARHQLATLPGSVKEVCGSPYGNMLADARCPRCQTRGGKAH